MESTHATPYPGIRNGRRTEDTSLASAATTATSSADADAGGQTLSRSNGDGNSVGEEARGGRGTVVNNGDGEAIGQQGRNDFDGGGIKTQNGRRKSTGSDGSGPGEGEVEGGYVEGGVGGSGGGGGRGGVRRGRRAAGGGGVVSCPMATVSAVLRQLHARVLSGEEMKMLDKVRARFERSSG